MATAHPSAVPPGQLDYKATLSLAADIELVESGEAQLATVSGVLRRAMRAEIPAGSFPFAGCVPARGASLRAALTDIPDDEQEPTVVVRATAFVTSVRDAWDAAAGAGGTTPAVLRASQEVLGHALRVEQHLGALERTHDDAAAHDAVHRESQQRAHALRRELDALRASPKRTGIRNLEREYSGAVRDQTRAWQQLTTGRRTILQEVEAIVETVDSAVRIIRGMGAVEAVARAVQGYELRRHQIPERALREIAAREPRMYQNYLQKLQDIEAQEGPPPRWSTGASTEFFVDALLRDSPPDLAGHGGLTSTPAHQLDDLKGGADLLLTTAGGELAAVLDTTTGTQKYNQFEPARVWTWKPDAPVLRVPRAVIQLHPALCAEALSVYVGLLCAGVRPDAPSCYAVATERLAARGFAISTTPPDELSRGNEPIPILTYDAFRAQLDRLVASAQDPRREGLAFEVSAMLDRKKRGVLHSSPRRPVEPPPVT